MILRKQYLTENDCYKAGAAMRPRGIMVHSTGADNPYLKRYVAPDDGTIGVNKYGNHWNKAKPDGIQICVHAFIGRGVDGKVYVYQTLPWDIVGWHSGAGVRGSAANANNNGYIGFEVCEDSLADPAYFAEAYESAAELCAYLCGLYGIKPASPYLIDHSEGNRLGIASAHGDISHWLARFGKTMNDFRSTVARKLEAAQSAGAVSSGGNNVFYRVQVGAYNSKALAEAYLERVKLMGLTNAFIVEVK
ncbi:hypothetical protein FACS1894133_7650 [Clostridia bacterium]|nr:hypothetical protein FACS1894133_7650 [Clostridia bacterium]